jgi:hypothetical protein
MSTTEKVSREDVQSIQKKIGDAFSQSSEALLVSAFQEALKKFEENEKAYTGTQRPTSTTGAMETQTAVPKSQPEGYQMIPTSSPGHYIRVVTAPPNVPQQQQVLIQPDYLYTIPTAASGNQVRVTGLYYPKADQSEAHKVVMAKSKAPPTTKPQRVIAQENPRQKETRPVTKPGQRPPVKTSKQCSGCGKGATFLCSGCETEWYCGPDCQVCCLGAATWKL